MSIPPETTPRLPSPRTLFRANCGPLPYPPPPGSADATAPSSRCNTRCMWCMHPAREGMCDPALLARPRPAVLAVSPRNPGLRRRCSEQNVSSRFCPVCSVASRSHLGMCVMVAAQHRAVVERARLRMHDGTTPPAMLVPSHPPPPLWLWLPALEFLSVQAWSQLLLLCCAVACVRLQLPL